MNCMRGLAHGHMRGVPERGYGLPRQGSRRTHEMEHPIRCVGRIIDPTPLRDRSITLPRPSARQVIVYRESRCARSARGNYYVASWLSGSVAVVEKSAITKRTQLKFTQVAAAKGFSSKCP